MICLQLQFRIHPLFYVHNLMAMCDIQTVFVEFKTYKAAAIATSSSIRIGSYEMKMQRTPSPLNLFWSNLCYSNLNISFRNALATILMLLLLLFWSVPAAMIMFFANIRQCFKWFNLDLEDYEWISERKSLIDWLEGFLSVALLSAWMAIVPHICQLITFIQKKVSYGEVAIANVKKYFDCLLVMLVLVTPISGTLVSNLSHFAELSIQDIGMGLARMSTFFMQYVLFAAMVSMPTKLFRFDDWFLNLFTKWTDEWDENYMDWPRVMIIFVLCITYSVISPLMILIALLYFVMLYVVFSYQQAMSFTHEHLFGGCSIWPVVFDRLMIGIYLSNTTLITLCILKKSYGPTVLLSFIFVFVRFIAVALRSKFESSFKMVNLKGAHERDKAILNATEKESHDESKRMIDEYQPPCLLTKYEAGTDKNAMESQTKV